jgi:hypothetical protein
MRKKPMCAAAAAAVAACIVAGGAAAHTGPGVFSSASAQAGAGFVINGSFTETGLVPGQEVTYVWSYHLAVGMGCGGKSVMDRIGRVTNTITTTADGSGNVTESFAIGLPPLSCANGNTPDPVKMMVRSIKIKDTTDRHRTEATGWFISKDSKGFTSAHPFH